MTRQGETPKLDPDLEALDAAGREIARLDGDIGGDYAYELAEAAVRAYLLKAYLSAAGSSVSLTAEARSHLKFLIQGGDRCDGVAGPCRHCAEIFAALASSGEEER